MEPAEDKTFWRDCGGGGISTDRSTVAEIGKKHLMRQRIRRFTTDMESALLVQTIDKLNSVTLCRACGFAVTKLANSPQIELSGCGHVHAVLTPPPPPHGENCFRFLSSFHSQKFLHGSYYSLYLTMLKLAYFSSSFSFFFFSFFVSIDFNNNSTYSLWCLHSRFVVLTFMSLTWNSVSDFLFLYISAVIKFLPHSVSSVLMFPFCTLLADLCIFISYEIFQGAFSLIFRYSLMNSKSDIKKLMSPLF